MKFMFNDDGRAQDYTLSCGGKIGLPTIHCVIPNNYERASEEAKKIAAALYKAGYFSFALFDEDSKMVESYSVEQADPIATVRTPR